MDTRINPPTDGDADLIREALGEALDLLLADGIDLAAIAQVISAYAAAALCHAAGPEEAARYLRDLASLTERQGHRYQATMAGGEH